MASIRNALGGSLFAMLAIAPAIPAAAAPVVGQIDDFEDGTTQGWTVGVGLPGTFHPLPPINVASGGPQGADDNYLLLRAIAGFGGAGSRMSVLNLSQWAGDYAAAGIQTIAMSASNFGPDDLSLRLLFANPGAGPPTDIAISTESIFLPAGSDWTALLFPIDVGSLTALTPGGVLPALTSATELRIFHNPAATFPGPGVGIPPVTAELGVDDIQALGTRAVPEPPMAGLLVSALVAVTTLGLRRGKTQ
jgi:hypothetical protein